MSTLVPSSSMLTAGIRDSFADAYEKSYEGVKARLADLMDLGLPSDKLTELYAYYKSAPHPRFWPRGEGIAKAGFDSVGFNVTNRDFGLKVEWHKNDRADDQTQSLRARAEDTGRNFALFHERVFFQLLLGSTDAALLPAATPNAPDGAALFATVDGAGNARFGATNGNLLTGTGVATSTAIRTDFWTAVEQFHLFQDTEGQPLWDDSVLEQGFTMLYGVANTEVVMEAFKLDIVSQAVSANTNAGISNTVLKSGIKLDLVGTQRITDNDMFVFAKGVRHKPIFQQTRQDIETHEFTMDNSELAAETKTESVQWDARYGYGIFLPYGVIKINN